jgi:uncharacterized protein (UPF0332 family)
VNQAFAASAFLLLKGAFVKAHVCIVQEFSALLAEFTLAVMVSFAVDTNHFFDCFLLTSYSRVLRS